MEEKRLVVQGNSGAATQVPKAGRHNTGRRNVGRRRAGRRYAGPPEPGVARRASRPAHARTVRLAGARCRFLFPLVPEAA